MRLLKHAFPYSKPLYIIWQESLVAHFEHGAECWRHLVLEGRHPVIQWLWTTVLTLGSDTTSLNHTHCQTAPTKHLLGMPRSGSLVIVLCDTVKLGSVAACGRRWWISCKAPLTRTILEFAPFSILWFVYFWEPAVTWTANQTGFSWEACRSNY